MTIQDEHVERLELEDEPDLVVSQVYITSARRAYRLADHYRAKGAPRWDLVIRARRVAHALPVLEAVLGEAAGSVRPDPTGARRVAAARQAPGAVAPTS